MDMISVVSNKHKLQYQQTENIGYNKLLHDLCKEKYTYMNTVRLPFVASATFCFVSPRKNLSHFKTHTYMD